MLTKSKNVGVNAILNVIKSCLSILFPLITYPYAVRILGADGIGKVNYSNSIVSYFSLFAMMGISTYSVREGAKLKGDKANLETFASEVFTINLIFTAISYLLLFLAMFIVGKLHDYRLLLTVQSLTIILVTMSVDWINVIYEDFLLITIRSIVSHIVTMLLLFTCVKHPDDYLIYASLTVINNGIICLSNWHYVRKNLKIRITTHPRFEKHLKPMMIMFANAVTITIYVNFDITMLGWIKGDYDVGLYTVAVKIYTIIKNLLAATYAVALPKLSSYFGKDDEAAFKSLYTKLWGYLTLILIPASIGLIVFSPLVMQIVGGSSFVVASDALRLLSISLVFAIYGGLLTACYNVATGHEKDNLVATLISAAINCLLNLFFIKRFSYVGAAITTLISELFVFAFCLVRAHQIDRFLDKSNVWLSMRHACAGSIIIILLYVLTSKVKLSMFGAFAIVLITSVILYLVLLTATRNPFYLELMSKVKSRLHLSFNKKT